MIILSVPGFFMVLGGLVLVPVLGDLGGFIALAGGALMIFSAAA